MSKKHKKKKQKLEVIVLISNIIAVWTGIICMIYETFFK